MFILALVLIGVLAVFSIVGFVKKDDPLFFSAGSALAVMLVITIIGILSRVLTL